MAKLTEKDKDARIAELEAKLAASSQISFKVSPKKAVSVYGMGRFPTTLYAEQWERLLEAKDDLLAFIKANRSQLKTR